VSDYGFPLTLRFVTAKSKLEAVYEHDGTEIRVVRDSNKRISIK